MHSTVNHGLWSNPATWQGNQVPLDDSEIMINHNIILDKNVVTCGIEIIEGASLIADSNKNILVDNCENIIVRGKLSFKPSSGFEHTIIFHDVDEAAFKGASMDMDIVHEDHGIWVRGNGILELVGTTKTAWTRLQGFALKGTQAITLTEIPVGWKVNDEISIAPTTSPNISSFYTGFDLRKITAINGKVISLNISLGFDHPIVDGRFTAEVMNLTRNVRVEGTGDGSANPDTNGRTHINIMSNSPFQISNIRLRHMGPRQKLTQYTDKIEGRYAVHLHHCGLVNQGAVVENVVVMDSGSHCFVPHATHGVTFRNCITYNTFEDAYWWDLPPDNGTSPVNNSNDIFWDNCIAAITKCDPPFRGYRLAGFLLGSGLRNNIENCVAVGNQGSVGAAGFLWPESSNYTDNVWGFNNNLAHNNRTDGIFVWENDPNNHQITNFTAYRNGANGIEHGAYTNAYKYSDCKLTENKNAIFLYANPIKTGTPDEYGYIAAYKRIQATDPLYITVHTLIGKGPTLFKDCKFSKVIVNELPRRAIPAPGLFDFVDCNLLFKDFSILGMEVGSHIRVQNGQSAYQIDDKGKYKVIPLFFNI